MSDRAFQIPPDGDSGVVLLPCAPHQFRDFIAGLLGRPQTITRTIIGPFEATRSDVENLHHLVCQRVQSQNQSTLLQFVARISFDDNSSITLNSIDEFMSFNEPKPVTSTSLNASWSWLITFPSKQHPEKQQIDVTFLSDTSSADEAESDIPLIRLEQSRTARIRLLISCTDRSWGYDIDNLITSHLEGLRHPQTGLRRFAREHSAKIGFGVGIAIFLSSLAAVIRVTNQYVSKYTDFFAAHPAASEPTLRSVSDQTSFLTEVIASGVWARYSISIVVLFLLSVIVSIVFGAMAGASADVTRPSFILLTKRAELHRANVLRRYRKNWLIFLASLIGAVAVGVLGNFTFYFIMKAFEIPQ